MVEVVKIRHNTPEWLEMRRTGIGASDAAAVLGISPFKTNVELWEEKVGLRAPDDLSDNPLVQYGKDAEDPLIRLFALDHPELEVWQDKEVVYRDGFMFASLDAEAREGDELGVVENKTAEAKSATAFKKWVGKIPDHYYAQVVHQLAVTGRKFAYLNAQIKRFYMDGTTEKITREYRFNRDEKLTDIAYLVQKETEFWRCVERRERPALILPRI